MLKLPGLVGGFLSLIVSANVFASGIEGFTEPYRKIDVGPSEPGLLAQVNVREGDAVKAGQIVGTLECDVLQVSLEIARAAAHSQGRINSALAERDLHQIRFDKLVQLHQQGHASQEEVDRAKTELAVTEANLQTAREQQAIDKLEFQKTAVMIERRKLRCPIDGVVTRIYKEEQELIAGNAPTVLTVVQLNPLRVIFSAPLAIGMTLKPGQSLPLSFSDAGIKVIGKVELVSPVTEAESGTVRIKVLIDNAQGSLRSGVRCVWEQNDEDKPLAPAAASPDVLNADAVTQ